MDYDYIELAKKYGIWYRGMSERAAKAAVLALEEEQPRTPGERAYKELALSGQLPKFEKESRLGERTASRRRHYRPRHIENVPSSPADCPKGTYYREGYYREGTLTRFGDRVIARRGEWVEPTCARMPRENPWWKEIHDYAKSHHVSGAVAAMELSHEMAEGLIPHMHGKRRSPIRHKEYSYSESLPEMGSSGASSSSGASMGSPRAMSPRTVEVGSSNVGAVGTNLPSVGAASVGSYGAGMSARGSAGLGSYE